MVASEPETNDSKKLACPECGAVLLVNAGSRACPLGHHLAVQGTDQWLGKVVQERYKLTSALGGGRRSTVYEGRDQALNRLVAVRIFKASLDDDRVQYRTALQIAKILAGTTNPCLPVVYDCGLLSGGFPFVITELVQGDRLGSLTLSANEAMPLLIQILTGLSVLHGQKFVLAVISIDDIIVDRDAEAASCKLLGAETSVTSGTQVARPTAENITFCSPEIAQGNSVSARSDIYSIASVFFKVLTGTNYSAGTKAMGSIDTPLRTVFENALAYNPNDRYQTTSEMKEALSTAIAAMKSPHSSPPTQTEPAQSAAVTQQKGTAENRYGGMPAVLIGAAAALALTAVCALISMYWFNLTERKESGTSTTAKKTGAAGDGFDTSLILLGESANSHSNPDRGTNDSIANERKQIESSLKTNVTTGKLINSAPMSNIPLSKALISTGPSQAKQIDHRPASFSQNTDSNKAPHPEPVQRNSTSSALENSKPGQDLVAAVQSNGKTVPNGTAPSSEARPFRRPKYSKSTELNAQPMKEQMATPDATEHATADRSGRNDGKGTQSVSAQNTAASNQSHQEGLEQVHTLALIGAQVNDNAVAQRLAKIDQSQLKVINLTDSSITDETLEKLSNFSSLTEIKLLRTQVTDNGVKCLGHLAQLRNLNLSGTLVTGSSFSALSACPLRSLVLHNTPLLNTLAPLAHSNLEVLILSHNKFDKNMLNVICSMSSLRKLSLVRNDVDQGTLDRLKSLPKLEQLNLMATLIDDSCVSVLVSFPHLKTVGIDGTNVTGKGRAQLSAAGIELMKPWEL